MHIKNADMDAVVNKVEQKVDTLQLDADSFSFKLEELEKECSFSSGMVEQLIKQFAKYREEYKLLSIDDGNEIQMEVIGNGPMYDMLRKVSKLRRGSYNMPSIN